MTEATDITVFLRRLACGTWRAEIADTTPVESEEHADFGTVVERLLAHAPNAQLIVYKMSPDSVPA